MSGRIRIARLGRLLALTVLASLCVVAPAGARDRVVAMRAPDAAGPARFNRVFVHEFGPRDGDKVLVLMPGTQGGAGDFTLIARNLIRRVDGLQVWAIDRRTQALEDTRVFRQALKGKVSLQEAFDYYLGWITNGGTLADHFQFLESADYPYARQWGMKVALRDAHSVVRRAKQGGRSVVLGGHSLGASLTVAYAAWDFNGKPGYRDLDGLVLIDGGLLGTFNAFDLDQAKRAIAKLGTANPFSQLFANLPPETAGLFGETAGMFARLAPRDAATTLQGYPLIPDELNPPFPVTDRALLGYAFDRDTSPLGRDLRVNAGGLAPDGDPRDWADGGVTPVRRIAQTFGQEPSELDRVVLPQAPHHRHQRRRSAARQRCRPLSGPPAVPRQARRPAALRASDGAHRGRRAEGCAGLHPAHRDDPRRGPPGQRRAPREPPRPADGLPATKRLFEDDRSLPPPAGLRASGIPSPLTITSP